MNVIFIMSDQQRCDSIGPDRHPCADYPVMERLRSQSVSFDSFYASAIPCVPSRQTMLTGRQEWMSRGWGNAKFNMGEDTTWMSILRENGFRCVSVGKTHQVHAGSYHVAVPVRNSFGDQDGWDHFHPAATPEPEATYFDIHATHRACDALRRLKDSGPFALFVGFHAPHEPYVMPERYLDFVRPENVPLPTARREDEYRTKSQGYRDRVEHFRRMFGGIDDGKVRVGVAGHHCLLKMVDDCLGLIMDTAESLGLLDDTVIVYCSDHGDLLGEHGLFNKAATFYESEIRIPFLIRFPDLEKAGTTAGDRSAGSFAAGIDVLPTLLDILGIEADIALPGVSLLPAVRRGEPVRDRVVCTTVSSMMIRTATQKLWVDVSHGDGEMYDLAVDPEELDNLYVSREASELRSDLFELMLRTRITDDRSYSRPTDRDRRRHQEVRAAYEPEV